jgi:peptidoglycan/xylan/chitin deacetylase (PgdA/CDA1 family)
LDWLKANNKKATFFVIGGSIHGGQQPNNDIWKGAIQQEQVGVLKRAFDEGHEIGIHSWSHSALTTLTNDEIVAEIQWTINTIVEITGQRPKYFRPPFGDMDDRVRAIVKAMNLSLILWNWDSKDWHLNNGEIILAGVMETSAVQFAKSSPNGGISLQHDLTLASSQRNPTVAEALLNAGVELVSMDECISGVKYLNEEPLTTTGTKTKTTTAPAEPATSSAGFAGISKIKSKIISFGLFFVL